MRRLALTLVLALLGSALACGGTSDTEVFADRGSGGTSSAGGRSESGGSTASAGRPSNASGMAGEAGSGDSEGGGPSSTGGSDSGGTSTGQGGLPSDGGMSGAGQSNAGAGGQAPAERCDTLCSATAEAACANDPVEAVCLTRCRIASQTPECASAFQDLFDCTEASEITCDSADRSTAPGCGGPYAVATGCFLGQLPDPELEEPCEAYCESAEAIDCDSPPENCVLGCQAAGSLAEACASMWDTYLECSKEATFYCTEDGEPAPGGCEAEAYLYLACLTSQ